MGGLSLLTDESWPAEAPSPLRPMVPVGLMIVVPGARTQNAQTPGPEAASSAASSLP